MTAPAKKRRRADHRRTLPAHVCGQGADAVKRAHYIGAPQFFDLNNACRVVVDAFGWDLYLVGSALERRDYRDVDLRLLLDDAEFDALFPGLAGRAGAASRDAKFALLCSAISLYLSRHSGLPVDFQIQRQTVANTEFEGRPRNAVGIFVEPPTGRAGT